MGNTQGNYNNRCGINVAVILLCIARLHCEEIARSLNAITVINDFGCGMLDRVRAGNAQTNKLYRCNFFIID